MSNTKVITHTITYDALAINYEQISNPQYCVNIISMFNSHIAKSEFASYVMRTEADSFWAPKLRAFGPMNLYNKIILLLLFV